MLCDSMCLFQYGDGGGVGRGQRAVVWPGYGNSHQRANIQRVNSDYTDEKPFLANVDYIPVR